MLNDIIAHPSNFKPLKKRREDSVPGSHRVISLTIVLVAIIVALAAIDYRVIRRLLKPSVRPGPGVILLIIIMIFFLNIFIAAGLTLFFGGTWFLAFTLAYAYILEPLYHRHYIRSFEAHIRQKPLQNSLQTWWSPLSTRDPLTRHRRDRSIWSKLFFKKQPKPDLHSELPMSTGVQE